MANGDSEDATQLRVVARHLLGAHTCMLYPLENRTPLCASFSMFGVGILNDEALTSVASE